MTLIPCPECSRAVSSAAFHCPGCGQPLRGEAPRGRRRRDRVLPLVIGGAVLASVLGYTGVWMLASGFHHGPHGHHGHLRQVVRSVDVVRVVTPAPPATRFTVIHEPPVVVAPVPLPLPELLNGAEVSRVAARVYPPLLRDAGLRGVAVVRVRVMEDGRPDMSSTSVESATHPAFGDAALRVTQRMRFRPARDGAAQWITIPISFDPTR